MKTLNRTIKSILVVAAFALMLGAEATASGQIRQEVKKDQGNVINPTLEVKQFSGDFTQWTNALTINSAEILTFRWSIKNSVVTSGIWQVNDQIFTGGPSPLLAKVVTSGSLPSPPADGNPATFTIDFRQIITSPPPAVPKRYYVRAIPLKGPWQPVGQSFPVVTITYAKPASGTQFQFDTLDVVSVAPSGGVVGGPPKSSNALNTKNSIEIAYRYELNTEEGAEVRQWLLLEAGGVAPNNFWFSSSVEKGKGKVKNRATIRCETATQKPTVIKAISYKLTRKGNILAEGIRPISGLTFTCPGAFGYLKITSLTPAGGPIHGPQERQNLNSSILNADNSVLIAYEYDYPSSAPADIRQWALRENGTVEPLNFWTFASVTKGKHTAQTRLTVLCKLPNQSPKKITAIKYGIYLKDGSGYFIEQIASVDFTFQCSSSRSAR